MGRMGSCVPRHIIAAALAPHCWNATSFADPEYVIDLRSPRAVCALVMTVLASCAIAFPHRHATQVATRITFFTTAPPGSVEMITTKQVRPQSSGHRPQGCNSPEA